MTRIKMYDFPADYEKNRLRYNAAFEAVCRTGRFSAGPFAESFEKSFAAYNGCKCCSGVNNGTNALMLALLACGIKEGDEVIVPSATFTATPGAVAMCGAIPVFADCDPYTWETDPGEVKRLITDKTKAVIGVHLYGGMFDVDAVKKITDENGLVLVEDVAQACGSTFNGRKAGTFGKAGCFSFYPTKTLGAFGEAGAVISDDEALTAEINGLKDHFLAENGDHIRLGYNMRMEGLQGAVMEVKLKDLPEAIERKRRTAAFYREELKNSSALVLQQILPGVEHSYHLFAVKPDNREKFRAYMDEKGIDTGVQYKLPCHKQKVFTSLCGETSLPVSEDLMSKCVSVPVYPHLTEEEIIRVADAMKNYK